MPQHQTDERTLKQTGRKS